jgi:hypothetical protein
VVRVDDASMFPVAFHPMQPPLPLVLVLCDQVAVDQTTGKTSIFGRFEAIFSHAYPAMHPALTMYAEFTDGHGKTSIRARIVRTTADSIDGEELANSTTELDFPDPFCVRTWVLSAQGLVFPEPGEYRCILDCGGTILIERRMMALLSEQIGGQ